MIDPARFSLTEQKNNDWTMVVEESTTVENLLNPAFFANIASQLRPYDRIRVSIDTDEWYADLLVVQCGRNWARVAVLRHLDFTSSDEQASEAVSEDRLSEYKIQYRGPHLKFSVIRKSDNQVLKESMPSKAEAEFWLTNHLKTILM